MIIEAKQIVEKERFKSAAIDHEAMVKNALTLTLCRLLEDKVEVKKEDGHFSETHSLKLVVLSEAQAQEIAEIVSAFQSYTKDYPAAGVVVDKLQRIKNIFLSDSLLR